MIKYFFHRKFIVQSFSVGKRERGGKDRERMIEGGRLRERDRQRERERERDRVRERERERKKER